MSRSVSARATASADASFRRAWPVRVAPVFRAQPARPRRRRLDRRPAGACRVAAAYRPAAEGHSRRRRAAHADQFHGRRHRPDRSQLTGLPTRAAINGEELRAGPAYLFRARRHASQDRARGTLLCARAFRRAAGEFLQACGRRAVPFGRRRFRPGRAGRRADRHGVGRARRFARRIVDAGGSVIVQDEASSAVWGMPGAVARAGLAAAVAPVRPARRRHRLRLGGSQKSEAP